MAILAVNAGSSTLKFSIHPLQRTQVRPSVLSGSIQGLGPGGAPALGWTFRVGSKTVNCPPRQGTRSSALHSLGELLAGESAIPALEAIAYRVVHGGQDFSASMLVTEDVVTRLARMNSLAPLGFHGLSYQYIIGVLQ